MIAGIGTDVIEVSRIENQMNREGHDSFRDGLFTENEIHYCEGKARSAQHYAARFAAKEAFFKALGTGWRDGLKWKDIEVVNDSMGRPMLNVFGKAKEYIDNRCITNIFVSLSHIKTTATAVVVLEQQG